MDALGFDIYGHHEGRENILEKDSKQESDFQDSPSRSSTLFSSLVRRTSASSSSKPVSSSYSRAIGATDFHLYNQDATGFDEDSSESSSKETTVAVSDGDKSTRLDQFSTQIDGRVARSTGDWETRANILKTNKSGSSSADPDELEAEERFKQGNINVTDVDALELATTSKQDVKEGAKLVGVFGRDFDEPDTIAQHLQAGTDDSQVVYRPVTIPRRELLSSECRRYLDQSNYDVVILCYNTSEARILLTGEFGFYTNLLCYASKTPGQCNTLFVLTHCQTPEDNLIEEGMKQRISEQPDMKYYVDDQIYSWYKEPSKKQKEHITMKVLNSQKQERGCVIL